MAKKVKIFRFLTIFSQKQIHGPKETRQIIGTLKVYLLNFGCFSYLVLQDSKLQNKH